MNQTTAVMSAPASASWRWSTDIDQRENAMADAGAFRNAMARLAGAVNIITTDGPSGLAGFTATAVCSVTDQPPTLLVCMNHSSFLYQCFQGNEVLCVNVMGSANAGAPALFADRNVRMPERFSQVRWSRASTGSPLIDDALVSFDCRIVTTQEVGSHSIFLCEVESIRQGETQQGLVYFNRSYHAVGNDQMPVCPSKN